MGWSCAAEAGRALEEISKECVKQTGSSNVFEVGGTYYMYETSRKEHSDGAITGTVSKFLGNPLTAASCMAVRAGSFRIESNGKVSRGPAFMKKAANVWFEARFKEACREAAAAKLFVQGHLFVVVE